MFPKCLCIDCSLSCILRYILIRQANRRSQDISYDVSECGARGLLSGPGSSLVVAFPTLLLVLPIVRRIVGALCEPASR
ncbi:MAG: DUF2798 domain-containing protein [Mesorhizobium sp.]|nr:MAG: DUF2798 domain-containing protein [Mesorhizobium sp.]RWB16845.1 MAG: DUF2798 domain-containing protein [Mesorhizobium sp.]